MWLYIEYVSWCREKRALYIVYIWKSNEAASDRWESDCSVSDCPVTSIFVCVHIFLNLLYDMSKGSSSVLFEHWTRRSHVYNELVSREDFSKRKKFNNERPMLIRTSGEASTFCFVLISYWPLCLVHIYIYIYRGRKWAASTSNSNPQRLQEKTPWVSLSLSLSRGERR